MLTHPTIDKLRTLQLRGMLAALEDQHRTPDIDALTFEERLVLPPAVGLTVSPVAFGQFRGSRDSVISL